MVGKWHVGEKRPHCPVDRGFEHYFGLITGDDNYFKPVRQLAIDDKPWHPTDPDFYMSDAFGQQAVRYIDEYSKKPDPYFLYVAFTAPHWPLQAWPDDIAKYRGKYLKGWDVLRRERYERQLASKLVDPRWSITPRDEAVPAWSTIPNKEGWDLRMAVYAAQVDRLDQNIGRILDKVKETGQEDNTLIIFVSHNGACAEENVKGEVYGVPPGPTDSFTSYHRSWANVSNTPFRLYKHWVHEGGISAPFIASWPAVVKQTNTIHRQRAHLIDLMPTILEAAGARYPEKFNGHDVHPVDGKSLLPTLQGRQRELHDALYWEYEDNKAIKVGDWKLVSRYPEGWGLYNLAEDRTELRDLSATYPNRVQELQGMWSAWASRSNVLPWDQLHVAI
jgi:arylsulfatase A-like enzyme